MRPCAPVTRAQPKPAVALAAKKQPVQQRSRDTYEAILGAATQLLADVGIERLSTNLVCQHAGITPPALYHYFPNKYAILRELGVRLMGVQNELLQQWATPATMRQSQAAFADSLLQLFLGTVQLTEQLPAGVWITRALRAVPALHHVRIESHDHVTALLRDAFVEAHPHAKRDEVWLAIRLSVESMYAAHELLFDEPTLDPEAVGRMMAEMVAGQFTRLKRKRA
jgi:AcrR family transcriptional regulator